METKMCVCLFFFFFWFTSFSTYHFPLLVFKIYSTLFIESGNKVYFCIIIKCWVCCISAYGKEYLDKQMKFQSITQYLYVCDNKNIIESLKSMVHLRAQEVHFHI